MEGGLGSPLRSPIYPERVDSNGITTPSPIAAALSTQGGFTSQLRGFLAWFKARKPVLKKVAKTKKATCPAEVKGFLGDIAETAALGRWTEPDQQDVLDLGTSLLGAVHGPKMVEEEVTAAPHTATRMLKAME